MAIRILSGENITGDITTSGKVNAGDRILTEATTSNALLQVKYNSSNYLEGYYDKLNVVGADFLIQRAGDTKIQLTSIGTTFTNLSNTSAASSSADEVKIGTFGAGRPAIFLGTSNTTYTNSTWFIENIGASGKFRIGRNGLDVLEIENNGASLIKGPSLTVIDDSDPSVAVSDTDTNYKGIMTWRNSGSENVLEFVTRYGGTYYTNNLVLDRGKVGIGTNSPNARLDVHEPSTTAPSLTMGAAAGQIFKNEDLEFAFGLNNASPYNGYIQTRFVSAPYYRNLAINPLGGNLGVGTNSPTGKITSEAAGNHLHLRASTAPAGKYWNFDVTSNNQLFIITDGNNGMNITNTGNVGIGVTSPVNKIQADYAPVAIASLTASSGTSSTNWNRNAFLMGTGASVSNALAFGVSGTANDRKAWIQSGHPDSAANSLGTISLNPLGGNVGIGTTSPAETLEVMKDGGAIIRLHDPGNNSWKLKADTDFHIYDDSSSDYVTIKNAGQVGIGSANAASRLEVNGVIQNQNAYLDPTFTVSETGMGKANGGTLQFTQGFTGTSSSGDTVVFRYNAISWKSWALDFTFTSTGNGSGRHVCSGNIGGYNNNSAGYNSNFTQNFTTAITVSMTNVGQNNVITFTGDFGIHMLCVMRYSQSGGDGAPTSARASLTYNS